MSESLSFLSTAGEAVSALPGFAATASGGVVLGDFYFSGFEVPEYIDVPGTQALVVHKLPGGDRVIDIMGDDPGDIAWSGTMMDDAPEGRAQELERMRIAGRPVSLQFGTYFYTVIIRSFEARPMYGRVAYSIACTVMRNEASATLELPPGLTDLVGSDVASALAAAPAQAAGSLGAAQSALSLVGRLVPGSPALAKATAILGGARGALSGVSAVASGALSGLSALSSAADLRSAATAAGTMARSVGSAAYLGRAMGNIVR